MKELRTRITNLKDFVREEFNESYSEGETIDKIWLNETIKKFNKQINEGEANYKVYFVEYVKKFIEDSKNRINNDTGRTISKKTTQKYGTTLSKLEEFEEKIGRRLKHKDINLEFHSSFVSFLKIDSMYGNTTIEKFIAQIKTFCRNAEAKGYPINSEYKSKSFTFKRQKPLAPYLNEKEIDAIYNLKILDEELDKIRDLFIIGLHTGLRISDLRDSKRFKIVGENIIITSTQKTTKPAIIPIHPYVENTLNKRNGQPPTFSITPQSLEIKFNEKIKEICFKAGITEVILGDKRNKETKRNVRGLYPKYQLVSSHICRRSFVSNNMGKLSKQEIMAITTHSTEKQLLAYYKISNDEHIKAVRDIWKKEEKEKSKLKVVS